MIHFSGLNIIFLVPMLLRGNAYLPELLAHTRAENKRERDQEENRRQYTFEVSCL